MRTAWNNTKRHGKTRARQNKPDIPANKRMEERGKMSKGSRIRKNKYRGINTSIIAETIKEIKPKKKSKRENDLE